MKKKFSEKRIIKKNTKTIRELRNIAKDKGRRGCYKLKKADVLALLLEQSTKEMSTPLRRSNIIGSHDSAIMTLRSDVESKAKRKIRKRVFI